MGMEWDVKLGTSGGSNEPSRPLGAPEALTRGKGNVSLALWLGLP